MPKLYSSKEIIRVLEKNEFIFRFSKGFAWKMENNSGRTVIVPMNKREIYGTFRSILKQSGISLEEFSKEI